MWTLLTQCNCLQCNCNCLHLFLFISKPCPCHDRFPDFRVNERFVIRSQIFFFYEARVFQGLNKFLRKHLNHFRKETLLFVNSCCKEVKGVSLRKFLCFRYIMIRGLLLEKCIFIIVSTILWKPDSSAYIWILWVFAKGYQIWKSHKMVSLKNPTCMY